MSAKQLLQVHFEEIVLDDVVFQLRIGFPQVGH
jgi:hypothetical protein